MGGNEFVRDLAKDRKKRQYGLYPALDISKCCPDKLSECCASNLLPGLQFRSQPNDPERHNVST